MTVSEKLQGTATLMSAWDYLKKTAPNLGAQEQPTTETTAIHILSCALISLEFNNDRSLVNWKRSAANCGFPF